MKLNIFVSVSCGAVAVINIKNSGKMNVKYSPAFTTEVALGLCSTEAFELVFASKSCNFFNKFLRECIINQVIFDKKGVKKPRNAEQDLTPELKVTYQQ
ncbi:hypothetical protein AVEN_179063-1 [Araneus ventricosus]|uniref:Uncharacterized protein n=1 Tax=Araneus ventricosus TaxID=182803 RepID=A0A4Y2DQE1_ARAVE|nr:hypothetical protein AVEN_10804-1 [Araneus ventricosus]GBM18918.1 hypothetical protein AVEN_91356-1 [Araneus ventricosus]GBM18926.1 hypothetical protein AVEN_92706-1 [Araneus ventricosus]GBM19053.1 hypothetical protein AVEN_179063-1 [Araneus ventricosus]